MRAGDDHRRAHARAHGETPRGAAPGPADRRTRRRSPSLRAPPARRRSRTSPSASAARYGVRTRSQPPISAPQARASCAYALKPAPPIPTNQSLRPVNAAPAPIELVRDLLGGVGPGCRQHCRSHVREARSRRAASERAPARFELQLPHHDRAARSHEVLGVQGLMVAGREWIRDEDRRPPGRGDLPHRSTGAGEHEVASGERCSEAVGLIDHAIVVGDAAPDELVVAPSR